MSDSGFDRPSDPLAFTMASGPPDRNGMRPEMILVRLAERPAPSPVDGTSGLVRSSLLSGSPTACHTATATTRFLSPGTNATFPGRRCGWSDARR